MRNAIIPLVLLTTGLLIGCGDDEGGSGGSGNAGSGGDAAGGSSTGGSSAGGSATGGSSTGGSATGGSGTGGSSGGPMGGAGGAGLPDGSDCAMDEECASGLCFPFNNGSKCTIECPADPNDCPLGKGCNNQSPPVCKV